MLPAMTENGGSIINITSDAGATGYPGWGAYSISKFGIEGIHKHGLLNCKEVEYVLIMRIREI
jgi:NAD(P)-dependent dehydrogenase (short-subunit alcohol dehydrogenase family)